MSSSSIKIDAFCPVGIGGTKGIDTTYLKLFVGGLSPQYSSKDLFDLFSKFGTIRESVVIPDRFRVRSRCYGFITFADDKSAKRALAAVPIMAENGSELTVVLASTNTKPRRAHFNVKHGISGHKPLPTVNEDEEHESTSRLRDDVKYVKKDTTAKRSVKSGNKKVGIYTDPSLFRTANIQQIAPAVFHVESKPKKKKSYNRHQPGCWPNEDIKKDYHDLKKVKVTSDRRFGDKKSWKLMASEQEPDKESYYGSSYYNSMPNHYEPYADDNDDVCSIKSREWTPIAPQSKYNNNNNRRARRQRNQKYSQHQHTPFHWNGVSNKADAADSVKYWDTTDKSDDDDKITVSSSVFNALFEEDMSDMNAASNANQTMLSNDVRIADARHTSNVNKSVVSEKPQVVDQSVTSSMSQPVMNYGLNGNGMWGTYEPVFSMTNIPDYSFQNVAPTPPVLPLQTNGVQNVQNGQHAQQNLAYNADCGAMNYGGYGPMNGAMNGMMMAGENSGSVVGCQGAYTSHATASAPANNMNYINNCGYSASNVGMMTMPAMQAYAPTMQMNQATNNVGMLGSVGNCHPVEQTGTYYNPNYLYNTPHHSVSNSK